MANFSRLRDLYAFAGFTPAATVRGVFGDPVAVVIDFRSRRKKHAAVGVVPAIARSTIKLLEESAMSIVAGDASTWSSPSDASSAASAKP